MVRKDLKLFIIYIDDYICWNQLISCGILGLRGWVRDGGLTGEGKNKLSSSWKKMASAVTASGLHIVNFIL